jgi:2-hydroxy-3-keto-5-methylthiopentenyl-1-phosphate phosphatase
MNVVLGYRRRFGSTAFVGEGYSDRYGALFADATFAKRHLAELCEETGIPFEPWKDYDDVRRGIEARTAADRRSAPATPRCPGWTEPIAPTASAAHQLPI